MGKSQKGGEWERYVSKYLTEWLTGQKKELYFWRSPSSGGMFTRGPENVVISGDIISLKPEADILTSKFSIECKNGYKEASLDKHLRYNKSDPIKSFWEQACDDAFKAKKLPMLIYKKLGLPTPWVGIESSFNDYATSYMDGKRFVHINWDMDYPDIYFYEMKEFFGTITPDIIKQFKVLT